MTATWLAPVRLRRSAPELAVVAVGVLSVLAAVLLVSTTGWGDAPLWALPALALAVALTEVAVVHLQFGRQRWTFSLTEAVIAGALVLSTGGWAVVAVALGVLAAQVVRRQPRLKLAFNVAQFAASAALAQALVVALGGGVVAAVVGMAGFWTLNYLLVAVVVSVTSQRSLWSLVASSALLSLLHTAGNSSIGLLAAHLAVDAPAGLLALVVPIALLWTSYDQEARRSAEARLFAELARGQEQVTGRSTDLSASVVVTAAARLFGGADVELVILTPEGPVRWTGDEAQPPRRTRAEQAALDEPWVLRALGARGVSVGTEAGRPYCAAVLGDPADPLAVLIARRRPGAASFGRREARLAAVLVGQAEAWLATADLSARYEAAAGQVAAAGGAARALGDLGAATTPSLTVLRDSASRLARLADDGGVDDIVEELHTVERAVASLLGAIALAAEPELVHGGTATTPAGLPAPSRPSTDWTTTGVLR